MYEIEEAIKSINPNAEFIIDNPSQGLSKCKITWMNGTTSISKTQIQNKIDELSYKGKRKKEYPSIEDQLDDIYHNGVDGWKTTIKAVKDKYPKEDND